MFLRRENLAAILAQFRRDPVHCDGSKNVLFPGPADPLAFFDTDPFRPNTAGFNGAWNVYPFFKSGTIIVSSIEQGLFMIRTEGK